MRNSRSTCLIWGPLSGAGLCQGTICVGLPDVATPGVGDGQGGLACCDSWGCKELDMTERLN